MTPSELAELAAKGIDVVLEEVASGAHGMPGSPNRLAVEDWLRTAEIAKANLWRSEDRASIAESLAEARQANSEARRANSEARRANWIAAIALIVAMIAMAKSMAWL